MEVDCREPEGAGGGMWGGVGHAGVSQPPAPNKWTIALLLRLTHASSGTPTQAHLTPWEGTGPIVQRLFPEPSWLTFPSLWPWPLQVLLRRLCQPFPLQPQPGRALPKHHNITSISLHPHPTRLPASEQATALPTPSSSGLTLLAARPPQPGPLTGNLTSSDPDR